MVVHDRVPRLGLLHPVDDSNGLVQITVSVGVEVLVRSHALGDRERKQEAAVELVKCIQFQDYIRCEHFARHHVMRQDEFADQEFAGGRRPVLSADHEQVHQAECKGQDVEAD